MAHAPALDDYSWVDPRGNLHDLNGQHGVQILRGVQGRGMPPMDTTADEIAGLDGSVPRQSRATSREVVLPAVVKGDSYRDRIRTLAALFDPRRGDGILRCASADGTEREIVCRYAEGMEIDEAEGRPSGGHQAMVLVFRGHDPFWRDTVPEVRTVGVDEEPFLSPDEATPWYPWRTVQQDALSGFAIVNDGDDVTWPQWRIEGPGGPIVMSNLTTGESLQIDVVLAAGEQIRIDTRPQRKTVTGPAGENLWPVLTDDSELWPIEFGDQQLAVGMSGAVAGETRVRLEWRRRWLTA